MATAPSAGSAPTISYANAPTWHGLVHEPLPDGVRITQPAPMSEATSTIILGFAALPLVLLSLYLGAPATSLFNRIRGWSRPTVFEVSGTRLRLLNVDVDGMVQDVGRERQSVYEVKFVSHSGNLVIRTRGRDIIDFRPLKDRAALEWIAAVLRVALGLAEGAAAKV